jgi:hypothetical protein
MQSIQSFLLLTGWLVLSLIAPEVSSADGARSRLLERFCLDCHSEAEPEGGFTLQRHVGEDVAADTVAWEKVVAKLRARQMPPVGSERPSEERYLAVLRELESELDRLDSQQPWAGRTETFRRLTRYEYQNAIRDLLALEIDAESLLPADPLSHGFDNVTVGELSPTLLNRYVLAAERIARLAVGSVGRGPGGQTFRVPADLTQERHLPGLPIGTRGGTLIRYVFPQDGEYEVTVRLMRDRNDEVEGLRSEHQLDVLLDSELVKRFEIRPPADRDHSQVDAHLKTRFRVEAGPHRVGVTFPARSFSLLETARQPYEARFNYHRHPRTAPAVFQVSITGPFDATGPGETPSRQRLFVRLPSGADDEEACAVEILRTLARRAWRRPVDDDDLAQPLSFYRKVRDVTGSNLRRGHSDAGFEAAIETAVAAILVNPQFLFRIERDPPDAMPGRAYRVSDLELASRLSFFLWSSVPDDELLDLAERGQLSQPKVLEAQTRRMLADERSRSLVENFADQWLYLRNLKSITPDMRMFPDFDDNLRQAMRRETELLCDRVVRENRSVLDLLDSRETFLNERLAKHYGIAGVYGSRFRAVGMPSGTVDDARRRGGLLRQASVLTVTSYATRTSPVIRGNWILENLLGTPAPPPPNNVPALKDNTVDQSLPLRDRLAQHRADPNCSGCHNLMDPVGFPLESFDATGRWRDRDAGHPIDTNGGLPDGSRFASVAGLEQALLQKPELFAGTLTRKLLTYALGRGVDERDAPTIRAILRQARETNYQFSSLIDGIVRSVPFQMRTPE